MGRLAEWFGFEERSPRPASSRILTATDGRDILYNSPDGWEVDQPWLWWTGPAGGDGTGGPWGNPPPGADAGLAAAGNLPAVARCTSIICDTIAGLPWHIFTGWNQLNTPSWIEDPQALRRDGRIISASSDQVRLSAVEFWAQWITSALWFGDGYLYVPVRDAAGAPKPPLWILHPQDVDIHDGRYWIHDSDVPFADGEIVHLRGEPPYKKGHGSGVIDRHGADLALAATVRSYAGSTFGTGVPAGYLKVNQPNLTPEQAADLKSRWMVQHGGTQRSIAVLNATTEFHPIALSPVDAELGAAREWGLRDIALAFGVPPYMLGIPGDSATYANVESRMIELRTFTLLPWIRRIESTLDAQLPRGTSLKVATDATLRADTLTRYQAYSVGLTGGWLTVDEIRAMENRPPLPVQSTTNPAEETLPPVEPPGEPAPPEPLPTPEEIGATP
jgi:HK97 family phage portal protein